jgi:hypothetical protein
VTTLIAHLVGMRLGPMALASYARLHDHSMSTEHWAYEEAFEQCSSRQVHYDLASICRFFSPMNLTQHVQLHPLQGRNAIIVKTATDQNMPDYGIPQIHESYRACETVGKERECKM